MKKILSFVLLLAIGSFAWADIEQGDSDHAVLFGFGYASSDDDENRSDDSYWPLELVYDGGYCLTENWVLGVSVGSDIGWDTGGADSLALFAGPMVKYNFFPQTNVIPFVGFQADFWYQQTDYDTRFSRSQHEDYGLMLGPLGGIKFFLDEATSLMFQYELRFFAGDIGDIIDYQHVFMVGFGFNF